jgi:hypothetical protein
MLSHVNEDPELTALLASQAELLEATATCSTA